MPTIWTIGYERLRPEMLAAELEAAGVERVIDVRERPQSRKPGMSKSNLTTLLAGHREGTARDELDRLCAKLDGGPRTALLCLEEDPGSCHRRVITEALQERRSDLEVVDL